MEAEEIRRTLRLVGHMLKAGEATHPPHADNHWQRVPAREHIRRGLAHAERALLGVASDEDELTHAACRLILAIERRERDLLRLEELRERTESRRCGECRSHYIRNATDGARFRAAA